MKAAICYYSYHHGNTRKVMEALCPKRDMWIAWKNLYMEL